MKKFAVIAKCGHVGRGKYIEREFPVIAESASAAAQLILCAPKVKKHLKNAITNVREIDDSEYGEIKRAWDLDPYIHSHYKGERPASIEDEVRRLDLSDDMELNFDRRAQRLSARFRKAAYVRKENKYGILVYA